MGVAQYRRTLLGTQPVSGSEAKLLHTLYSADSRRQLWTQQACVGSLVCQAAHGCELLVDGVGRQPTRFEVHAVASNYDPVECQARLGAVPCYELVEGKLVDAARSG